MLMVASTNSIAWKETNTIKVFSNPSGNVRRVSLANGRDGDHLLQ